MSITVKVIGVVTFITINEDHSFESFKLLVQRAVNLWPDAPPEIKEFADKITNDGKVQQDYQTQEYYKVNPPQKYYHYHRCPICNLVTPVITISPDDPVGVVLCTAKIVVSTPTAENPDAEKLVDCGTRAAFNSFTYAHK